MNMDICLTKTHRFTSESFH